MDSFFDHRFQFSLRCCRSGYVRAAVLIAVCTWGASLAWGQEFGPGVLLLKDTDRVLAGRITQRGDFYDVELAENSRVSVPANRVAQIAASLEELYQIRRRSISRWNVGDHYQLTRWCLLHNLLGHAAEHYCATLELSPDHPRVRQLGLELQERLLRDDEFRRYLGLATPAPTAIETAETTAASAEVVSASTFEAPPLEHPEIARQFIDRIQPILISRCGQAACHGAQSNNALRLQEPYAKANVRIASANLNSVMAQLKAPNTEIPPLLRFATEPHSIQKYAAIPTTDTRILQEFQNWIAFVRNPVVTAVVTDPLQLRNGVRSAEQLQAQATANPAALNPVEPGGARLRPVPQRQPMGDRADSLFPSSAFPVGTQPPSLGDLDALDAQLEATLGDQARGAAGPPSVRPATSDPFDPAEFNRKSRPQ